MIFTTCSRQGKMFPAILKDEKIYPLSDFNINYKTLEDVARFISDEELDRLKNIDINAKYTLNEVNLMPAILEPFQEIVIMENNFVLNNDELPTYFYKKASIANPSGSYIPSYPGHVKELDYQVEVCAVVRNDVFQVSIDEARNHIFGYVLINNVIARNLTLKHRRPYIATSLDGYLLMGSLLVTADEFDENTILKSYVNNELRQNEELKNRKFDFAYAISDLSRVSVLRGGTMISSGTPFGTAKDLNKEYLKSGDVVTVEAGKLGTLSNIVY